MFNSFLPYEKQFRAWIDNKFEHEKLRPETKEFILHILNPEREKKLWTNQQEGILRAIFAYEILGKGNLLLNIVTGGGKTAIIAGIVAWLRMAYQIRNFIILTPNIIVRDRLEQDFEKGRVFRNFKFFPAIYSNLINDLQLHLLGQKHAPQGMLESGVILGNIQQLYSRGSKASRNLAYVMNFLGDLAIFNDEAHNTPAPEYTNILMQLAKKSKFRLDTTATPDRADNQTPDSEMVYEYGIQDALEDDLIKSVVVYQPDIKKVELTYTDIDTGKQAKVEEIDWDEIDRKGISPTQWVTDEKPLKQQIKIALQRLEEQKERAKNRYKPVLFVVAVCIRDAKNVVNVMEKMGIKTLLVTEEEDEEHRREAAHIGHTDSPYDAVVSVLMLREGWDVPEVSVILLLRKFSSRVYGQQVIGRGLRKIIREGEEREILAVVDHPKLEHGWLWKLVSAKIKQDVSTSDKFDVEEDLPEKREKQELIDPEKLIEVPEAEEGIEPNFEDLLKEIKEVPITEDWKKILNEIKYPRKKVEITGIKLRGVRKMSLDDKRQIEYESADETDEGKSAGIEEIETTYTIDELREELKKEVLELSAELLFQMGFGSVYRELLYNTIMNHIDDKIFNGKTLGLTEQKDLEFALYKMPEIRRVFMKHGLVPSIIRYPYASA